MEIKHLNLNVDSKSRLLFISDVHGNLDGFIKILEQASFSKDDYLFIIGDIIEKGEQSLPLIEYILNQIEEGFKIYCVMGNCEELLSYMKPPVNKESLLNYVLTKKTILNEFARRLNIRITKESNLNTICWYCYRDFKKYYDFLLDLPHIITINDKINLVHGGFEDFNNLPDDANKIMKNDNFYIKCKKRQEKLMIVGHYPTINYHDDYPNLNPIIDNNKNIISIDGGNNVVPWGQLNLLIIDNIENMNISYLAYDGYKEIVIEEDVLGNNLKLFNMPPYDNDVEIESDMEDYYLCKHIKSGTYIPILKLFVMYSKQRDEHYAYDAFNYMPSLHKGSKVKLVYYASPYSIIKINGVVGLVDSKYIKRD